MAVQVVAKNCTQAQQRILNENLFNENIVLQRKEEIFFSHKQISEDKVVNAFLDGTKSFK